MAKIKAGNKIDCLNQIIKDFKKRETLCAEERKKRRKQLNRKTKKELTAYFICIQEKTGVKVIDTYGIPDTKEGLITKIINLEFIQILPGGQIIEKIYRIKKLREEIRQLYQKHQPLILGIWDNNDFINLEEEEALQAFKEGLIEFNEFVDNAEKEVI